MSTKFLGVIGSLSGQYLNLLIIGGSLGVPHQINISEYLQHIFIFSLGSVLEYHAAVTAIKLITLT